MRPFVAAEVDGHPVSLVVHSNAGFRAMVTHASPLQERAVVDFGRGTLGLRP